MSHFEKHRIHRAGWLRASVLGANDGIISTASLLLGVWSAGTSLDTALVTGVAGLVAGAMSMAAGEYVSVSSQADMERADLARERQELADKPEHELIELREIYVERGLDRELAAQVAQQLSAHDALGAHARDELGISAVLSANPLQAAWSSALSFALGALAPVLFFWGLSSAVSHSYLGASLGLASALLLAALGWTSALAGGAPATKAVTRILFWGTLAMAFSAAVGRVFAVSL